MLVNLLLRSQLQTSFEKKFELCAVIDRRLLVSYLSKSNVF